MRLASPITPKLADPDHERVRREHEIKIKELQALPASSMEVIKGVSLVDATDTVVNHPLGREPIWVGISAPRAATGSISSGGWIEEKRGTVDRRKQLVLHAQGYAVNVIVDVTVM